MLITRGLGRLRQAESKTTRIMQCINLKLPNPKCKKWKFEFVKATIHRIMAQPCRKLKHMLLGYATHVYVLFMLLLLGEEFVDSYNSHLHSISNVVFNSRIL